VQPGAQLRHRRRRHEAVLDRARPGDEELDRLVVQEGRDGKLVLTVEPERTPAGDEQAKTRRGPEQLGETGRSLVDLLEVVQQQQCGPLSKVLAQRSFRPERGSDLGRDELGLEKGGEAHEHDAVRENVRQFVRRLEGDAGLAGSPRAGERHETGLSTEKRDDLLDLSPPSHEHRRRRRQASARA